MKFSYVTPPTSHGEKMLLIEGAENAREAKAEAVKVGALPDTLQQYSDGGKPGFAFRLIMRAGGYFKHERGDGWLGVVYVSNSLKRTLFIRPDTDHGVRDCTEFMQRIVRMSDTQRLELITV